MTSEQIEQLEKLLEQVFGFTSFRPGQLEIIETILAKQNVLLDDFCRNVISSYNAAASANVGVVPLMASDDK